MALSRWAEGRFGSLETGAGSWAWIAVSLSVLRRSKGVWPWTQRWTTQAVRVRLQSRDGSTIDDLYLDQPDDTSELARDAFTYRGKTYAVRWLDGDEEEECSRRFADWP